MQELLIVQVGSYNKGCTRRRKPFLYKSFTFYYFTYTAKFFCDNYFQYKSLSSLTSYPRESFISLFSGLFSPLVLFFFCSRIPRLLCLLFRWSSWAFSLYSRFSWSESRRHSVDMFWIDLTKIILSIRPGLWLSCTL